MNRERERDLQNNIYKKIIKSKNNFTLFQDRLCCIFD